MACSPARGNCLCHDSMSSAACPCRQADQKADAYLRLSAHNAKRVSPMPRSASDFPTACAPVSQSCRNRTLIRVCGVFWALSHISPLSQGCATPATSWAVPQPTVSGHGFTRVSASACPPASVNFGAASGSWHGTRKLGCAAIRIT